MRWAIRSVIAGLAFVSTVIVLLDASNVWQRSTTDWHPGKHQVATAIVVLAFSAFYSFADALLERSRARRRDGVSVVISELLFPLWCRLSQRITNKSVRESLGVHVWLVPSWYALMAQPIIRDRIPARIRRRLWTPGLWRAAQYRQRHEKPPTGISWKRGKGAIGAAWRRVDTFYFDMSAKWGADELDQHAWDALPPSDQLGLNFHEYKKLNQKYGSVLVTPIFRPRAGSNPPFLGCVVVDLPRDTTQMNLDNPDVRNEVYTTAFNIERAIDGHF